MRQSNTSFFSSQLSIADLLYYWEISTLQSLLKRDILPANSDLEKWYKESMLKMDSISQIEQKAVEALAAYQVPSDNTSGAQR